MKKKNYITTSILTVLLAGLIMIFLNKKSKSIQENSLFEIPTISPRLNEDKPSTEFSQFVSAANKFRNSIQNDPDNVNNYNELAQLFLQEARTTGNHHDYIPKAEILLDEALRRQPENFSALAVSASVLMIKHRFPEARVLAEKALKINPHSAFAYGVLSDAYLEMGDYEKAIAACDKMLAIRPDLRSYARASYLREIHGDTQGAITAMQMAADASVMGQENRAWALYNLGKLYLKTGAIDTAEFIFNGILEERKNYSFAYSGLSKVAAARGEFQQALELLRNAYRINPDHGFMEELTEIYTAIGDTFEAAQRIPKILQEFYHHEEDGWNVNLEFTSFCTIYNIKLDEALDRIENEYQSRPENVDVLDAYAWALYKTGQAEAALPMVKKALRLNTQRPSFYYHAGMIFKDTGQHELALQFLEKALQSPYFPTELPKAHIEDSIISLRSVIAMK